MDIVLYPDPRLTAKNEELKEYGPEASARVAQMLKRNSDLGGAGLAAPQVGWNVRLFVLSAPALGDTEAIDRIVWNPRIETSGEILPMKEGCLSFPGVWAEISRFTRVRLIGQTPEGAVDLMFADFGAQAVQHEMDHLDGILFLDRMTDADRRLNRPFLRALEERARKNDAW